jgi:hypothetical protein
MMNFRIWEGVGNIYHSKKFFSVYFHGEKTWLYFIVSSERGIKLDANLRITKLRIIRNGHCLKDKGQDTNNFGARRTLTCV